MMMLEDIRDYIASLDVAEHVYMGKLPDKEDKSVGCLLYTSPSPRDTR